MVVVGDRVVVLAGAIVVVLAGARVVVLAGAIVVVLAGARVVGIVVLAGSACVVSVLEPLPPVSTMATVAAPSAIVAVSAANKAARFGGSGRATDVGANSGSVADIAANHVRERTNCALWPAIVRPFRMQAGTPMPR